MRLLDDPFASERNLHQACGETLITEILPQCPIRILDGYRHDLHVSLLKILNVLGQDNDEELK